MSSLKSKKLGLFAVGITVLALAAVQGCSSSDDTQATPPSGGSGSRAGAGNSDAGSGDVPEGGSRDTGNAGTGNNGGSGDNGGSGNTGNSAGAGDVGNEAGFGGEAGSPVVNGNCTDSKGCYTCAPTNSTQFENVCPAGGCPDTFTDVLTKKNLVGTL